MNCLECGRGRMQRKVVRIPHEIRGVRFEVQGQALVCARCGFQVIPADRIEEHGLLTDRAYRRAAGLLAPGEIRHARESLGFSQQAFAAYLGVGEASVKRWELGALQDKSSDDLIRLKTDPEYARQSLEQLRRRLSARPPVPQRKPQTGNTDRPSATARPGGTASQEPPKPAPHSRITRNRGQG